MYLKYDLKQLEKALGKGKAIAYSRAALKKAFLAALYEAQGYTAEKHLSAPGRAPEPAWPIPQHRLRTDSQNLRGDWLSRRPEIKTFSGNMIGNLNSGVSYAEKHSRAGQRQPFRYGVKGSQDLMSETIENIYYKEIEKAIRK